MGICKCTTTVVPRPPDCAGCLVVVDVLIGCANGPLPCNASTIPPINLAALNDLTACTTTPIWTLKSYDVKAFQNVVLGPTGVLTFETKDYYKDKDFIITYQVDCPNSNLRAEGQVKVCFQNPCTGTCKNCNPCNGNCITAGEGNMDAIITSAGCLDVLNEFSLDSISNFLDCGVGGYYTLQYSPTIFLNMINVNGGLSFNISSQAVSGSTYDIVYTMFCPAYDIKVTGVLHVHVKSKCHGITCNPGEQCDECSGLCVPIPPEVSIANNEIIIS